ncbi:EamA family transporter RarD [Defluviimonas sp. WL0024]|uniref:EamA family transporter RarD n=1 Tax=Albidovulum salinarum TaxID=2984153 RepID=A0ABT2WY64_9RHOB|nr:EamA family transporter RarD [Defluviimonas sp. WL0024]MCU9846615.1 EamA family transporter RarD [Defluviimonas sp. WL0024]
MSEAVKGVLAMVLACTVWGLSGIFYKAVAHVPPPEVLAHRTLWSLVFFLAVLAVQGRLRLLPALVAGRSVLLVAVAALMISANWFGFIWSIQNGRAIEASLGYYIFPLVAVMIGRVIFGETLSRGQWAAVALAALAVTVLTGGLGAAPWIALFLATTFGIYGLLKRRIEAGPVVSVAAEVTLLAPVAALWLWGVHSGHWGRGGGAFGANWHDSVILALSGILTGGPLMLFSYATKRVRMATVGLVQYLNPTLQFAVAALIFAEPVTLWHMIAFPLIWTALAVYSLSALRQERRRRQVPVAV